MKRTLSILLLFLTLAAAVKPTLAFHYCGGSLHSVSLTGDDLQRSCCGGEEEEGEAGSCCSDYTVEVATDDYQTPQQEVSVGISSHDLLPAFFVSDRLLKRDAPDDFLIIQRSFPPGGLAEYDADLLSLICVFRI
ncbi:hypothetical protein Barb4_00602 [Bacteroidales bacterium Barb4]|nr:hypothetical protein Barb4_00602 [Bacteroidales bacterium Barb4]